MNTVELLVRQISPISPAGIAEIEAALRVRARDMEVLLDGCAADVAPRMRQRLAAVREALHATECARPRPAPGTETTLTQ